MKLEEIFSFDNLYRAYKNCRKSKQHKGEVVRFEANLSYNLNLLNKELITKKYKFGNYKRFYIYEPKERLIEALPFKDRVAVRCFCDEVLKHMIENKLIYDNAACRKGKGTTFAVNRLQNFLRKAYMEKNDNNIYFLKCDIRKYFPSINHDILIEILESIGFTDDEMWFVNKIINEQPNKANKGLPLGNFSSQWFALLYLNKIDHYIKEQLRIKYYVRYMDDMILVHRNKDYLIECKNKIEKMCNEILDLQLNEKTGIGMVKNGIDFLGYRHIVTNSGKIIVKLRQSSKRRMRSHLKAINKLYNKGIVDDEYIFQRKNSYYDYIKDTNESMKLKMEVYPSKKQNNICGGFKHE